MKKTKYLVAALLLMGATTTFTSCIDNDEPAGITELRGAKAELLKAKAVVEQARAQYVLAQAEYQKALAAHEQANAEYRKAETAYMQAKADYAAAESAEKQAWAEKQMAQYKLDMEEAALRHQTTMVNLQNNLAIAQRNYEVVLKQIEIAQAVMSDKDKVTVEELKAEANKQFALIFGGSYMDGDNTITVVDGTPGENQVQSFKGKVKDAYDEYYTAMENKVTKPEDDESDYFIPQLELDLELKEATLAAANEKVAKLEAFLNEDVETNDWRKAVEELEDSINILKKEKRELLVQAEEVKASQEYRDAEQAYKGITDEGEIGDENETDIDVIKEDYKQQGTAQKLVVAEEELKDVLDATDGKAATVKEFKVETTSTVMELVNGELETDYKVPSGNAFVIAELKDEKGLYKFENGKVEANNDLANNVTKLQKWVEGATKAEADVNAGAIAELTLEAEKKKEKEASEKYLNDKTNKLDKAIAAYNGDVKQDDIDATKGDLLKAVNAFTAAHSTLEAAVKAYNSTYESIYNAGYQAGEEAEKARYRATFFTNGDETTSIVYKTLEVIQSGLGVEFAAVGSDALRTEANAIQLIKIKITDAEKQKEAIAKLTLAVDDEVNSHYATSTGKEALANAGKAKAAIAISEAEQEGKELYKAEQAYTEANTGQGGAVDKFKAISTKYTEWKDGDVKTILAQVPSDDAKTLKDITGIDGIPSTLVKKLTSGETGYVEGKGNLSVVGTGVTTEEFADYTLTEFGDATLIKSVVKNAAEEVYGVWGAGDNDYKIVAPSAQEMRDKFGPNLASDGGSYGAWIAQQDVVADLEEKIASSEDLKKVVEDLTKMLADYKAEIESVKTATYGEEIKAYDDAVVANDKAKAAYEAEVLKYNVASLDADKLQLKIEALGEVKSQLIAAIRAHLGINLVGEDEETTDKYDVKSFTEQLQRTIDAAKQEVVTAQREVEQAKINLDKAQNGDFDEVALAKSKLDAALAQLQKAQDDYDAILANIQTALEIMAKTAE